jgi:hypothetical protein
LRIVERPVTPYLLWEMHWFKILAEKVRDLEHVAPLPEIVVDEHALYHVRYDADWRACGARRIDDTKVMRQAIQEIADLWESAEPFSRYFHRAIEPLTPASQRSFLRFGSIRMTP